MSELLAFGIDAGLSPVVAYSVLFLFIAGESAGLLLPGETALITAGVLAGHGQLRIGWVIAIAIVAASFGDNIGFAGGRYGGRRLLEHPRLPAAHHRALWLDRGDAFFSRHGGKAVAAGRFLIGVRVVIAWVAGINRMEWRTFLAWNLGGAVIWATVVGLAAYWFGDVIEKDLKLAGVIGVLVLVVVGVSHFLIRRRRRRAEAPRPHTAP